MNVTSNLYQRDQFEDVVFVDINWEAPFDNVLSILEEFYINSSCSCLDSDATIMHIISYYIVEICAGLNCTQATVTNSTEYQHMADDIIVCENDTELQIAVSAVSISGNVGEKSNSTTPEIQDDLTCGNVILALNHQQLKTFACMDILCMDI